MRTDPMAAVLGDCCTRCGKMLQPGEPTSLPVVGYTGVGLPVTELTCQPCGWPRPPLRVRVMLRAIAYAPAVLAGWLVDAWLGWAGVLGLAAGVVSGVYAAKWLARQVRR